MNSLLTDLKRGACWLRLNRSDRGNSLDPPTLVALRQAVIDAQKNEKVKVVVLTGTGTKDFCTGIDVTAAAKLSIENRHNVANIAGDIATLLYYGKPSIVGLNGRTMGMGIVFASASDYRIVAEHAILQMPEVNIGIFPGASCIAIMTRVCGIAWARRILLSGEEFSCEDALAAGIVDEIAPIDDFENELEHVVSDMSHKNSSLLKSLKWGINTAPDMSYMKTIQAEQDLAQYYAWTDSMTQLQKIAEKYQIQYALTGDPQKLLGEYKNGDIK
jgi:enoyl-CoA hydratase/carnithine racemase